MPDFSMRALRELKDLMGFYHSLQWSYCVIHWSDTGITYDLNKFLIASLQIFDAQSTYGIKD